RASRRANSGPGLAPATPCATAPICRRPAGLAASPRYAPAHPRGAEARGVATARMKVSFFETGRYRAPRALPPEWPVPSGADDREAGAQAYPGIIERLGYVQALG